MEPVEIAAGKYQLRPWTAQDLDVAREIVSDPLTWRWMPPPADPPPAHRTDPEVWLSRRIGFWEEGNHASFALMDAVTGEVYADISIQHIDLAYRTADVGYWVRPHARRRGIAVHGVNAVSRWAFGALGLHRIALFHAAPNAASCGVAQRAGFALEGVMRDAFPDREGVFTDEHVHARLATDPPLPE